MSCRSDRNGKGKLGNMKTAYEENGGGIKGAVAAGWEGIKGYYSAGFTFVDNLSGGNSLKSNQNSLKRTSGNQNKGFRGLGEYENHRHHKNDGMEKQCIK